MQHVGSHESRKPRSLSTASDGGCASGLEPPGLAAVMPLSRLPLSYKRTSCSWSSLPGMRTEEKTNLKLVEVVMGPMERRTPSSTPAAHKLRGARGGEVNS